MSVVRPENKPSDAGEAFAAATAATVVTEPPPRWNAAPAWQDSWWEEAGASELKRVVWRGVEAQHLIATMRLVDTLEEQDVLERILEDSKPPVPTAGRGRHYLLSTPFRYASPHASRFRPAGSLGIWYGAEDLHTACAEVAYWRWRFLLDSEGLEDGELLTEHTMFQARVHGLALDLTRPPWNASRERWTHPSDYSACQALAAEARSRGVQWIRYASARAPVGFCAAVLTPECLALHDPARQQTWVCKVTKSIALLVHGQDRLSLVFDEEDR